MKNDWCIPQAEEWFQPSCPRVWGDALGGLTARRKTAPTFWSINTLPYLWLGAFGPLGWLTGPVKARGVSMSLKVCVRVLACTRAFAACECAPPSAWWASAHVAISVRAECWLLSPRCSQAHLRLRVSRVDLSECMPGDRSTQAERRSNTHSFQHHLPGRMRLSGGWMCHLISSNVKKQLFLLFVLVIKDKLIYKGNACNTSSHFWLLFSIKPLFQSVTFCTL